MSEKFIESAKKVVPNIFKQMLQIEAKLSDLKILDNRENLPVHDVTGVIGIAGDVSGYVALNFEKSIAAKLASSMLGMEIKELNSDVIDAVGELVNVIAGNMKTDLSNAGVKFDIAIPSVITGKNISCAPIHHVPAGVLVFNMSEGSFTVELVIKEMK